MAPRYPSAPRPPARHALPYTVGMANPAAPQPHPDPSPNRRPFPDPGIPPERTAAFRRLCRSSPWRWSTLRFEVAWFGPGAPSGTRDRDSGPGSAAAPAWVRAWLRRPDALRVETPEGHLLHSTTRINASRSLFYAAGTRASWMLPPQLTTPVYDDDGLVRRRPEAAYGDPSFGDPRWAAVLDPVELGGAEPAPTELPFSHPVRVLALEEATHAGRAVLEAVLTPNRTYRAAVAGHPLLGPGRTRVRIDAVTAVCVSTEVLDGPGAGSGHDLRILGVDEYMLDDLFVEHPANLTDVRHHVPWVVGHGPEPFQRP